MKATIPTILSCLLLGALAPLSAQKAWSYRGIPYVTDNVPDEIMPAFPDGADAPGFPYDPCTLPTPEFVGGPKQYYVDSVNGNDSTAGNSGRGTVEKPRQSLPGLSSSNWRLDAGAQVFITANSSFFSNSEDPTLVANGTSESVCWIIGVGGRPKFRQDKLYLRGSHLIMDHLLFENPQGPRIKFGNGNAVSHMTLRHSIVDGLGTSGQNAAIGGSGASETERSSFICIYKNVVRNMGRWDRQDRDGVDRHAIQMAGYTDHWWIVDNEVYHCEGDSVQVATSQWNHGRYAARPHYIYIAGNKFYENYENAVDCKNCYHVFISENVCHDFRNEFKPANKTAIILSNDSEGWLSGYQWALHNTIYDCGTGIKIASTAALTVDDPNADVPVQTEGERTYAIGNSIYDCDGVGIALDARGTEPKGALARTWPGEIWILGNSIEAGGQPINQSRSPQSEDEPTLTVISGNILWNNGTGSEIELLGNNGQIDLVNDNLIYRAGGSVYLETSKYDSFSGNILNKDPKWVNRAAGDLRLQPTSPALNALAELPSAYQSFEGLYGIDISPTMVGTSYDFGAFEYVPTVPAPQEPKGYKIEE